MLRSINARLRPRAFHEDEAGFTIIEVMVAMMVFAIMSLAIAYGITNALQLTQSSRGRATAVALASQDIDQMRQTAAASTSGIFNVLPTNPTAPITQTLGGVTYSIARAVNWVDLDGSTGACGAPTNTSALAYKSVVDTVTWTNGRGNPLSTTVSSAIAPANAVTSVANGTVAISVTNAAGTANANVAITLTPISGGAPLATQPAPTDSQGCAYATNVAPGTYTLTAVEAGGIDTTQSHVSTQSVTVVAGASTPVLVSYDQAATVTVTYGSNLATLPTNMQTTFSSGPLKLQPLTTYPTTPTITSASKVPVPLFPLTSGYVAYAGTYSANCLSPNPTSWPAKNSAGQTIAQPNPIVTAPGGSSSVNVRMGVLAVSGVANQFITAVTSANPGGADPGCSAPMTLTFPQSSAGTQTIALPYGTWTLYSGSQSGAQSTNIIASKASNVKLLTPGNVNQTSVLGVINYNNTVTLDPRGQS